MKTFYLSIIITGWLLHSCSEHNINNVEAGVYARYSVTQFGDIYDTLRISISGEQLVLKRNWVYNKTSNEGNPIADRSSKTTTAVFGKISDNLREDETGNLIRWHTDRKILTVGSSEYRKIK